MTKKVIGIIIAIIVAVSVIVVAANAATQNETVQPNRMVDHPVKLMNETKKVPVTEEKTKEETLTAVYAYDMVYTYEDGELTVYICTDDGSGVHYL